MSKEAIKSIIREKFGYTADLKELGKKGGEPTEGKVPQPSAHPMEKFRNVIKAVLGATNTEQDAKIENLIDFNALLRLASKHGLNETIIANLKNIQSEVDKPKNKQDRDVIVKLWTEVKDTIPYWFLGLLPVKEDASDEEKLVLTNLIQYMNHFNDESEKFGKEKAKETPTDRPKSPAKSKKVEDIEPADKKSSKPEVPEDPSKKEGKEYKK